MAQLVAENPGILAKQLEARFMRRSKGGLRRFAMAKEHLVELGGVVEKPGPRTAKLLYVNGLKFSEAESDELSLLLGEMPESVRATITASRVPADDASASLGSPTPPPSPAEPRARRGGFCPCRTCNRSSRTEPHRAAPSRTSAPRRERRTPPL